jgi:Rrf2 family protein
MNTNQQFSVSIHVLTLLAAMPDQLLTSEQISESVNTNPVVIRRVMGHLREHGLVESRPGASGGWKLSRAPEEIHLCSVYDAFSHDDLLGMHRHPNADCPIGAKITPVLEKVFSQAEKAMHDALSGFTVKDVLLEVTSKQVDK